MKRFLTLAVLLLSFFSALAQEEMQYKVYSYAEFFRMIENEPSEQFSLKNASIELDSLTDQRFFTVLNQDNDELEFTALQKDSITISKEVMLENVFFKHENATMVYLAHISFQEKVTLINSIGRFYNCKFEESLSISFDSQFEGIQLKVYGFKGKPSLFFENSSFKDGISLRPNEVENQISVQLGFNSCLIERKKPPFRQNFNAFDLTYFGLDDNTFKNISAVYLNGTGNRLFSVNGNTFEKTHVKFYLAHKNNDRVEITENKIENPVILGLPENIQNARIDWEQFPNGVLSIEGFGDYEYENRSNYEDYQTYLSKEYGELIDAYIQKGRIENKQMYKKELQLLGILNDIYKKQHDTESDNASYIALKDLETARLAFTYKTDPSFDTFFEWKVNQFLKTFSAYGTRPAKAIVFSLYVILAFALIYLFFPNHWDSHGKNRIVDRFSFFLKYMKKDAGMQDVYLEEKQQELMAYDDYKQLIESSGKEVPKFFQATALPMYKWAISGTKMTASMLSRIDVMKGTWSELPQSKRVWKSVLLITAFLIALLYDIFIKMLNALMLSINTFTTLGFGEIPIKGLPRYLAIIQGFIGWFMLTIFSVSLISQLLN